jgi:hypothetical protein
MVAIRLTVTEQRDEGFMLLVMHGPVRTFRGEIYVCRDSVLKVLDEHGIRYVRVPHPVISGEVDPRLDPLI